MTMRLNIFFGILGVTSAIILAVWASGDPHPTPDQLYGCTVKQQAPNGDCP